MIVNRVFKNFIKNSKKVDKHEVDKAIRMQYNKIKERKINFRRPNGDVRGWFSLSVGGAILEALWI